MCALYSVNSTTVGSRQLSFSGLTVCTRDRGEGFETLCRFLPVLVLARPRIDVLREPFSLIIGFDILPCKPVRVAGAIEYISRAGQKEKCDYTSSPPPRDCIPLPGLVLPPPRKADRGPRGVDIVSTTFHDRSLEFRAHQVYHCV